MKYLTTFRNWKHRNAFLAFLSGFFVATLIWLSIKGKDVKLATELLNTERKRTEQLQKELVPVNKLIKSNDSLLSEITKLRTETEIKRQTNFNNGKTKINNVPFEPNDKLQLFITEWAKSNGGNVAE